MRPTTEPVDHRSATPVRFARAGACGGVGVGVIGDPVSVGAPVAVVLGAGDASAVLVAAGGEDAVVTGGGVTEVVGMGDAVFVRAAPVVDGAVEARGAPLVP